MKRSSGGWSWANGHNHSSQKKCSTPPPQSSWVSIYFLTRGEIFGYTTNGIYLPQENVYVIALTNPDDMGPADVTTRMAALAIGKPFPDRKEMTDVAEEVLLSYSGVYAFEDTDQPLPERTESSVDVFVMETYVGEYELQPGFSITITLDDGHLMTRATGQNKFEVFPESETKFFLKVVDAQIEFLKNDTGVVDVLMLYQGGAEIRAEKVK